jgi:RNA polymerase sigma-70 factor, ECF subfamily
MIGRSKGSPGEESGVQPIFDAAWRRRALAGEPAASQLLADSALLPLFRFCFHRVGGDRHRCEEVVQETLLRALRDLEQYDPARSGDHILPWLTGLARNEITRVLSRDKHSHSLEALWLRMDRDLRAIFVRLETEPFPDEIMQRDETRAFVNATMAQLPQHYRLVLEAKYVEGRSVRQMAENIGSTEKSIESMLSRARQAFRETFLALTHNLELGIG